MIQSFKHKGLKELFVKGKSALLPQERIKTINQILTALNGAHNIKDCNLPGKRLHEHKGKQKGTWSLTVSGNTRILFKFDNGDIYDVDFDDPH